MKYSFIVPVYNGERYLEQCLESILDQRAGEYEICLIDDGSTDHSPEICDAYAARYELIKVLHLQNGGVSRARNAGIECASGEYICFVDCDDLVSPCLLETVEQQERSQLYLFGFTRTSPEELAQNSPGMVQQISDIETLLEKTIYDDGTYYEGINCNTVWAKLYSRSLIGDSRFVEGMTIGEDKLFHFDVLRRCPKALWMPDVMYYCRTHGGSVMNSMAPGFFELGLTSITILDNMIEEIPGDKKSLYDCSALRMVPILKTALVLDWCHKQSPHSYKQRKTDYLAAFKLPFVQDLLSRCDQKRFKGVDGFYFWLIKRPFWVINLAVKHKAIRGVLYFLHRLKRKWLG